MEKLKNPTLVEVGISIREARTSYNLTQQDLADLLQISDRTLRSIEKGDPSVAVGTVMSALRAVGIEWSIS